MNTRDGRRRGVRRAGRAMFATALVIALLVCAGLTWFLVNLGGDDGAAPGQFRDGAAARGEADAGVGREAPATSAPRDADGEDPGVESPEAAHPAGGPVLVIRGEVRDGDGPLAGMRVCWIPLWPSVARRHVHDGMVFGESPDPLRAPAGNVRDAVTRMVATHTDGHGRYELRTPRPDMYGSVFTGGGGYAVQVKGVEMTPVPPLVAEVPVAVDGGAPADSEARVPGDVAPDAPPGAEADTEYTLDFVLDFAAAISGRVTDAQTGAPARGMEVLAGTLDPDAPAMLAFIMPDAPSAFVGEDGRYRLVGLPLGTYRVAPRRGTSHYMSVGSKEAARVVLLEGRDARDVDFTVTRGGRIHGVVSGTDGAPLEGATCAIMPHDPIGASMSGNVEMLMLLEALSAESDAGGSYQIAGVPLDTKLRVSANHTGYAQVVSDAVVLSAEAPELELHFALHTGWSIAGTVVEPDGTSAPGVKVQVWPELENFLDGMMRLKGTATGPDGEFVVEHLAAGTYLLHAGEIAPQELLLGGAGMTRVVLDGTGDARGVRLTIAARGADRLAGVVYDTWGNRIEGAEVTVAGAGGGVMMVQAAAEGRTASAADGSFEVSGLKEGPFTVRAEKQGFSEAVARDVAAGATEVSLVLKRHGRITGKVAASGGGVPGAGGRVRVHAVEEQSIMAQVQRLQRMGGRQEPDAPVEADGAFSVEAPATTVEVVAFVPGFAPSRSEPIEVLPGQEYRGITIRLRVGGAVFGKVTLADSTPIAGAIVRLAPVDKAGGAGDMLAGMLPHLFGDSRNQAVADAQGRFEIKSLPPGDYTVNASHEAYAPSDPVTVALADGQTAEISPLVLYPGGVVSGRVLQKQAQDGTLAGKPGMLVQIIGAGSTMKQTMADDAGAFRLEGLGAGEYVLTVVDLALAQKGGMSVKTVPLVMERGETHEVEVVFGTGYVVSGGVTGAPRAPMRVITLRRPGGSAPEELDPLDTQASVDAAKYQAGIGFVMPDDTYRITDVAPGTYIMEMPVMPSDPSDLEGYAKQDRTPQYRAEITVTDKDLRHDIEIK